MVKPKRLTQKLTGLLLAASLLVSQAGVATQAAHRLDAEGFTILAQSTLSIASVTSAHPSTPAGNILDGNTGTMWETDWSGGIAELPAQVTLDLGAVVKDVSRVLYTPRQAGNFNGTITEYEIWVGTEVDNLTFKGKGSWALDRSQKTATFPSTDARYVQLKAIATTEPEHTVTCSELNIATKAGVTVDSSLLAEQIHKAKEALAATENATARQLIQDAIDKVGSDYTDYTQEGLNALIQNLQDTLDLVQTVGRVDSIKSGEIWPDDTYQHIQAHGGGILYNQENKTYYWYGEHKGEDNIQSWGADGVPATGVSCYSSKDLYNWKNEGVALPVFNNPKFGEDGSAGADDTPLYLAESSEEYQNSPLPDYTPNTDHTMKSPTATLEKYNSPERIAQLNTLYADKTFAQKKALYEELSWNRVVERPKVIYNEKTQKYVMWFHSDGPKVGQYTVASGGVAVSDSPTGPFTYLGCMRMPDTGFYPQDSGMLRDMTLFVDDDQTGYIIFASEENATTVIQKLNEEYTAPSGDVEGEDFVRIFTAESSYRYREAPAVFKEGDNYYMITSAQTGWAPNRAGYAVSTDGIFGNWTNKGDPCVGPDSETATTFRSQSTFVLPYRDNDGNPVKGKFIYMGDRWISNDLKDSRYIWLPIELDNDTQTVRISWSDSWKVEDLNPLTSIAMQTPPDKTEYRRGEELSLTGAVLAGQRTQGSPDLINLTADMVSGYDKNTVGVQTLTVTYEGFTTTFTVTVTDGQTPSDVNKSTLEAVLGIAKAHIDSGAVDALEDSAKERYLNAFNAAKDIYESEVSTQEQVDKAWKDLIEVVQSLGFIPGDKVELILLIAEAEAMDLTTYEDDAAKDAFEEALENARTVRDDKNALEAAILAAKEALLTAIESLTPGTPGDKTELQKVIETAEGYDLDGYVQEETVIADFTAALAAANAVNSKTGATQAEINEARRNLLTAMTKLRLRADKKNLNEWLEKLKKLDLSKYTAQSAAAVRQAIAEAEAVAEQDLGVNEYAYIQAAINKMEAAEKGLQLADPGPDDESSQEETPSDAESGDDDASSTDGESKADSRGESSSKKAVTGKTPATGDGASVAVISLLTVAAAGVLLAVKKRKH